MPRAGAARECSPGKPVSTNTAPLPSPIIVGQIVRRDPMISVFPLQHDNSTPRFLHRALLPPGPFTRFRIPSPKTWLPLLADTAVWTLPSEPPFSALNSQVLATTHRI